MFEFFKKKNALTTPKDKFVHTVDNSLGFVKEDYLSHNVWGSAGFHIRVELDKRPYMISADYHSEEARQIALNSLVEIIK